MVRPTSLYCSWAPSLPTIAFHNKRTLKQAGSSCNSISFMEQLLESQICHALDNQSICHLGLTVADLPRVNCFLVLSDALYVCTFSFQLHCTQDCIWSLYVPHVSQVLHTVLFASVQDSCCTCSKMAFEASLFHYKQQHFLFTSLGHHNPLTRGGCCVPRRAISPCFLQIPVWWIDYNLSW